LSGAFIEDLDRLAPRRFLAVVDLSKIQHLPLKHAAIMNASVFDNRPCPMFLPVLATNLEAQKHHEIRASPTAVQGAWSALQAFAQPRLCKIRHLSRSNAPKIAKIASSWRSRASVENADVRNHVPAGHHFCQ
jgi:hypothetical protein